MDTFEAWRYKYTHSTRVRCGFGVCLNDVYEGKIISGGGPILCPCDHMPKWHKIYPDQQNKRSMARAIKAKGRHGSRVQRNRRRHKDVGPNGEWLPLVEVFG